MPAEDKFTNKTHDYDRHRPHYPDFLIRAVSNNTPSGGMIADIGAGTGYVTLPLAKKAFNIMAVEPNADMRLALSEKSKGFQNVQMIASKANQMGDIPEKSIDMITLGNVAHWLDRKQDNHVSSLAAFQRILKNDGKVAVLYLHPSPANPWLLDVFTMVKTDQPDFDIKKIMDSFSKPETHAKSFVRQVTCEAKSPLQQMMSQDEFYHFLLSHSFCHDGMASQIGQIFDQYKGHDDQIAVRFDSGAFVGEIQNQQTVVLRHQMQKLKMQKTPQ